MHGTGGMGKVMRAIGLMSGTAMDGIDVALIETDGHELIRHISTRGVEYPAELRRRMRSALETARTLTDRTARPADLQAIEDTLTQLNADAVMRLMGEVALQPAAIDVIGFHGQTILHRPEARLTVQLGNGARLAQLTGIDVVYDLRAADIAAGGQGAPLVPAYHRALAARLPERPAVYLNIGGVANVTFVGGDGTLLAFDTGPGNALMDDWVMQQTGQPHDVDGALAAKGYADEQALRYYLSHPYFAKLPPKSLDRNQFPLEAISHQTAADGAATLLAFTVESIARARAFMPQEPRIWIVSGGGRRNRTLMTELAERVENVVVPAEAVHLDGDGLEAEAWAYLAVRSLNGDPITFPGTTGIGAPATGGVLARAPVA
jgi:anhydro-N-acetylmuramic acid kinase